ncbi:MAG: CHAT domain-containing protein [Acidobacteriota bacterium]|nr:CHAT domain-containing protein [Acidobacteriota bacterium]
MGLTTRETPRRRPSAAAWTGAAILSLSVSGASPVHAQAGEDATSLPSFFRPNRQEVATLVYEASPGRPVALTFVPGSGGDPVVLSLNASAGELHPLVAELRQLSLLRPPASLGRIVRLGDELGDVLLAPIAAQLRNVAHLALSADGPLSDLPFGAIRAPRSLDSQGRFLIETRTLCWVDPALAGGDDDNPPAGQRPVALAIADAVYRPPARPLGASMSDGGISWRLHAARRNQASTIRALGMRVVSRFGQAASPALLWESTESYAVRFLHVAVEARIDPGNADRSALLLSPEEYDEQAIPVTAGQLASRLALEREALVVLSGLDTGDHGIGPGPFVEAFGAAGAGSLVASLWPVLDESATHLFTAFYSELTQGATPVAALREAQRRLMAEPLRFEQGEGRQPVDFDASHPYYWAGYRLYRRSANDCG